MFDFLVTNLESFGSFNKLNILMFHYLYHYVTINESKEKLTIVFYCFSATKNIVASSSSNFPTKLICCGILVFVCLDKSIPISL